MDPVPRRAVIAFHILYIIYTAMIQIVIRRSSFDWVSTIWLQVKRFKIRCDIILTWDTVYVVYDRPCLRRERRKMKWRDHLVTVEHYHTWYSTGQDGSAMNIQ